MSTIVDLLKVICWIWDVNGANATQKIRLNKSSIDEILKLASENLHGMELSGENCILFNGYKIELFQRPVQNN